MALASVCVCRNSTTLWVSTKLMVLDGSLRKLPCCLGASPWSFKLLQVAEPLYWRWCEGRGSLPAHSLSAMPEEPVGLLPTA